MWTKVGTSNWEGSSFRIAQVSLSDSYKSMSFASLRLPKVSSTHWLDILLKVGDENMVWFTIIFIHIKNWYLKPVNLKYIRRGPGCQWVKTHQIFFWSSILHFNWQTVIVAVSFSDCLYLSTHLLEPNEYLECQLSSQGCKQVKTHHDWLNILHFNQMVIMNCKQFSDCLCLLKPNKVSLWNVTC